MKKFLLLSLILFLGSSNCVFAKPPAKHPPIHRTHHHSSSLAVKSSYENNVVCNVEFQKYESLNLSEKAKLTVYTNSYHGTKFNILDKVNQEDVTFIYKYPEDKTGVNTFFGGKVEWRYNNEEVY